MNESKRLIKNTGIIALGNLSTKVVSFLLLPLYTAILSTEEYGTVDYIVSLSAFCVPFISILMDESMFRFLIDCKNEKEKTKVITVSIFIILTGGCIFLLIAIPVLACIKYQYSVYVILFVLTSVMITMMSALLRGIGRTDQYAIFNFLTSLIKILLNILLIAVLRMGIRGMLLASIFAHAGISFIFILTLKLWKYISFKELDKVQAEEMVRYSIPLIPNKISWLIINLSDRIVIMNAIGESASGLYAVAYKFPTFMDTIYGFFYQSWKESSARILGEDSQDDFYNMIYSYLKDFMFSIVLGMISFMPVIFHFLINDAYSDAIVYVPILLLAMYFSNMSGFYGGIFTAYKDTKVMGVTTIVAAVINLGINLAVIGRIGLYAAAVSTLIANVVVYLYRKVKIKKHILLAENRKKQIISQVITVIVLFFFYFREIRYVAAGCILSIIYAVYMNRKLLVLLFGMLNTCSGKGGTNEDGM